jgi:hypothetical protein
MVGTTGEIEAASLWAGQSIALARQPQQAAENLAELVPGLETEAGMPLPSMTLPPGSPRRSQKRRDVRG